MFFYLEIVIIIKEINYEKTTGTYIFLFKNSYHNKKTSTVTSAMRTSTCRSAVP